MVKALWVLSFLIGSAAGCASLVSSVSVSGSTEDGETFKGILDDTEFLRNIWPRGDDIEPRHQVHGAVQIRGNVRPRRHDVVHVQ